MIEKFVKRVELNAAAVITPLLTVKSFIEALHGPSVVLHGVEQIDPSEAGKLSRKTADAAPVLLSERPSISPVTVPMGGSVKEKSKFSVAALVVFVAPALNTTAQIAANKAKDFMAAPSL